MTSRRWRTAVVVGAMTLATLVGVAAGLPASAGQASTQQPSAATSPWKVVPSPNVARPNAEFKAVSCASSTWCVAVGRTLTNTVNVVPRPLIEVWNGTAWRIQTPPSLPGTREDSLDAVSCASATSCVAIGNSFLGGSGAWREPFAFRWNGKSWSLSSIPPAPAGSTYELNSVSCPAAGWCVAVGTASAARDLPLAAIWNGKKWTLQQVPKPPADTWGQLTSVSCPAQKACVVVGRTTRNGAQQGVSELWNGTAWTARTMPQSSGTTSIYFSSVSCSSPTSCLAVGIQDSPYAALVDRWNGSTWTQQQQLPKGMQNAVSAVSCPAANRCVTVGSSGDPADLTAGTWNGSSWVLRRLPQPAGGNPGTLVSLSCPTTSWCASVGYRGERGTVSTTFVQRLQAGQWAIMQAPTPAGAYGNALRGVSCVAPAECLAVGNVDDGSPLVERSRSGAWRIATAPAIRAARLPDLNGVACLSATRCLVVGSWLPQAGARIVVPLVATWNGTSWSTVSAPSPGGSTGAYFTAVSCASASSCMAVGNFLDSKGRTGPLSATWNGTAWTVRPTPVAPSNAGARLDQVSCPAASSCMALGNSGENQSLVMTWNGKAWTVRASAPAGLRNALLEGLSCTSRTACTAVGHAASASGTWVTLAQRWDGTGWTRQATPNPAYDNPYEPTPDYHLTAVSCAGPTACEAVGSWYAEGTTYLFAESWNGSRWALLPIPNPQSYEPQLVAMSCAQPARCTAVGSGYATVSRTLIASRTG